MSSTANALADAKAALDKADKFTKNVEGKNPGEFAKKSDQPAPKETPKPKNTLADELRVKRENVDQYAAVHPPTYHRGGKIQKDGEQVINAEKGETVLPNHDTKRATELAMDHLKGMVDGLSKKEDKPEHKSKKRKKGRVTKTIHEHHENGSHTTKHIHDMSHPDNEGVTPQPGDDETTYSSENMDGLHNGLEEHVGEPAQGEAEADAGQHGIPDEVAAAAGLPKQGA